MSSKKSSDVPGGRATFSSDNPHGRAKVMNGSGRARRGGAEKFEGGAQIAPTAGIRSEVISHGAGTKLGVDVSALPREGDRKWLI